MKRLYWSSAFLLITVASYAQFGMPSYKDVVAVFFAHYSFDDYGTCLRFQRKKDGWYISRNYYTEPGKDYKTVLFWSLPLKSYVDIPYTASDDDSAVVSENVNRYFIKVSYDYDAYSFQRDIYYGYTGWDWDIIQDSLPDKKLNDTLLESKARAYSNYASGFLGNQYGFLFVNGDKDRVVLKATEAISKARVDKFISYELEAIDYYKKLAAGNPGYITKVGSIQIKIANEYMYMYSSLMMSDDEAEAKKYAEKAAYPDSLLEVCKRYLKGLPKNSILITYGDNDTYPVWYLQAVKRYRPDIAVLNYQLLGLKKYLFSIDRYYKHSLFSTNEATFLEDDFDYFLYNNISGEDTAIAVSKFLSDLQNNHNPHKTINYNDNSVKSYYTRKLYFSDAKLRHQKICTLQNALWMNDYFLLDIVNTQADGKVYISFDNEMISDLLVKKKTLYKIVY